MVERGSSGGAPGRRRWAIALGLYLLLTLAYAWMAPSQRWHSHTPYNHYALQADAWLQGHLHLPGPPPAYAGNNDFALYDGKHYISFGPFPAVLITPLVAAADSVEQVRDGLFFLWLAALAPVLLFMLLERLREVGRNRRSQWVNASLAGLFGLGTVYWFSAVQGTVWFAGHVVASALLCGFLWCSVDAERPLLAGLLLALGVATRPSLAFALPWFIGELVGRARRTPQERSAESGLDEDADGHEGAALGRWRGLDVAVLLRRGAMFAVPLGFVGMLLMWHNHARFGDPLEFGHRLLTVAWRERIERWGLFSYHYLGRNLSVVLAGLPFHRPDGGWQINGHGLALWITTPIFAWALWPRKANRLWKLAAVCAIGVAAPALLYQNSGWLQFGYRFSNDFAALLFVMIAVGGRRFGTLFWLLASWSIALNAFGAASFGKADYARYYFIDPSQKILFQPD